MWPQIGYQAEGTFHIFYFENMYHIVPFQITFKYRTYIKSIIYKINFSNQILSKINSISNHTYIDFNYIRFHFQIEYLFKSIVFESISYSYKSILYKFDNSQIKYLATQGFQISICFNISSISKSYTISPNYFFSN